MPEITRDQVEHLARLAHIRMTDEELDRHIRTLEVGSPAFYDAVIARVLRRRSAFPVVVDDPEHAGGGHDIH